jgi:hypothetical protein
LLQETGTKQSDRAERHTLLQYAAFDRPPFLPFHRRPAGFLAAGTLWLQTVGIRCKMAICCKAPGQKLASLASGAAARKAAQTRAAKKQRQ